MFHPRPQALRATGIMALVATLAAAGPVHAQYDDLEPVGGYGATLAAVDKVSSKGMLLGSLAAILQQDRYNVNVRRIRQSGDSDDGFFAGKANRQAIAQADILINPQTRAAIRNGTPALLVDVFRKKSDGRLVLYVNLSDGDPAG